MKSPDIAIDASSLTESATATTEEWVTDTRGQPQNSSPAVGSHVYVGGLGSAVTALDPDSGDNAWTVDREGSLSDSSPTVADGTVYVGTNDGRVLALQTAGGDVEWEVSVGTAVYSTPAVGDGAVFVTTSDGQVVALETDSGHQRWSLDTAVELMHSSRPLATGLSRPSTRRPENKRRRPPWTRPSGRR